MQQRLTHFPINLVYSGFVNGDSTTYRGVYGRYWSAMAFSGNDAYNLNFGSSYVYPGTTSGGSKYRGRTIRCVATDA